MADDWGNKFFDDLEKRKDAQRPVERIVMRLRELAAAKHDDLSVADEAAYRITELEDLLFKLVAMNEAPCFCCGYRGPGYFQPSRHPCAERHHKLCGA